MNRPPSKSTISPPIPPDQLQNIRKIKTLFTRYSWT